jgi:hypothetical protein
MVFGAKTAPFDTFSARKDFLSGTPLESVMSLSR